MMGHQHNQFETLVDLMARLVGIIERQQAQIQELRRRLGALETNVGVLLERDMDLDTWRDIVETLDALEAEGQLEQALATVEQMVAEAETGGKGGTPGSRSAPEVQ